MCMNAEPGEDVIQRQQGHRKAGASASITTSCLENRITRTRPSATSESHPWNRIHGENRPLARIYFVLDEDDLNRSNQSSAVCEKLQFNAPPEIKKRLEAGLDKIPRPAAEHSGSADDPHRSAATTTSQMMSSRGSSPHGQ